MSEEKLGIAQIPIRVVLDELEKDLEATRQKLENALTKNVADRVSKSLSANLKKALTGGLAAVVGGVGVAAFAKLVESAAGLEGIQDSFQGISDSADQMLSTLQQGSLGMVSNIELMKSYNSAVQLVSKAFADQLPEALGYLSKASASTGQDMGFMIDSLVKGVGRLSPMILDNLGIQVALSEATARAAEIYSIEADQLNKTQVQAGMMSVVLEKLETNTADMPEVAGSASQQFGRLETSLANVRDELGTAFLPVAEELVGMLQDMMPAIQDLITAAQPLAEEMAKAFADPATMEGMQQMVTGLGDLAGFLTDIVPKVSEFSSKLQEWSAILQLLDPQSLIGNVGAVGEAFDFIKGKVQEAGSATVSAAEAYPLSADMYEQSADQMEAVEYGRAVVDQAQEAANGVTDGWLQMRAKMMEVREELLDPGFGADLGAIYSDAFGQLEDLASEHQAAMTSLQQDFLSMQADAELQHQMESLQATANYQAQAQALAEAGKGQELAELDAKFQAAQTNTDQAYAQQQRMAQLHYVQQQIEQQRAYIAELQNQRKKTLLSIAEMALQYNAEGKLSDEGMGAILGILTKGQGLQLQQQVDHAANMMVVSGQLSSGMVGDAIDTVNGINAAYDKNLGEAEKILAGYETDFEAIRDEILASIKADVTAEDFGFDAGLGGDLSRSAQRATEPATRALADVAKQLDEGIQAARDAIQNLVGFEIPAGFDAGLDQFGLFIQGTVSKIYGWLDDPAWNLKPKLEAIKDQIAPLTDVIEFVSTRLDIAISREPPDLATWAGRARDMIDAGLSALQDIADRYGQIPEGETESTLVRLAALVDDVVRVLSLMGQDLSIDPGGPGWADDLVLYVGHIALGIEEVRDWLQSEILDAGLAGSVQAAAGIVEHVETLLGLLTSLNKMDPGGVDWPARFETWLWRAEYGVENIRQWMWRIEEGGLADAMARAASIADSVDKLANLLDIGLDVEPYHGDFERAVASYIDNLDVGLGSLVTWLDTMPAEIAAALDDTAALVGDVKDIFELLDVGLSVDIPTGSVRGFAAGVDDFTRYLAMALAAIADFAHHPITYQPSSGGYEDLVADFWAEVEAIVPAIESAKKALDILDVELDVAVPTARLTEKLTVFFGGVIEALGVIDDFIRNPITYQPSSGGYDELAADFWAEVEAIGPVIDSITKALGILDVSLDVTVPAADIRSKAERLMDGVLDAAGAVVDALMNMAPPARSVAQAEDARQELLERWQQFADIAPVVGDLEDVLGILGTDLDIQVPVGDIKAKASRFATAATDAAQAVVDALQGMVPATRVALSPEEAQERLNRIFGPIHDMVPVVEDITGVLSLLEVDLNIDLPDTNFGEQITLFLQDVSTGLDLMVPALERIQAQFTEIREGQAVDLLDEATATAAKLQELFGILELKSLFESLQTIKPLQGGERRTALSNVITDFLTELENGAPLLKEGLARVDELFEGAMDYSIAIAGKIQAIMEAIGGAISSGIQITTQSGDWSLGTLLDMIDQLGQAAQAVGNIPMPCLSAAGGGGGLPGSETTGAPGGADQGDTIREAIIDGIRGSTLEIALRLIQDPRERQQFSMRLGRIEQMVATLVTQWEAANG